MAGEQPRASRLGECWPYRPGIREPYPVLHLRLLNAALEDYGVVEVQVDTGYEGPIMLPRSDYEFFMAGELPRSLWRTYRSLTGVVTMRVAHALVEIGGRQLETYVESPLYGGGKRLVGRELLNKLVTLLNGPQERACILEDG